MRNVSPRMRQVHKSQVNDEDPAHFEDDDFDSDAAVFFIFSSFIF